MGDAGKPTREHPLHQIAQSPTHKLLLKQWLKEEELIARRASLREARLDGVRREIAFLCCAFFVLHSAVILVLFGAARRDDPAASCRRSWVPCLLSLVCSMAMVWVIRYNLDVEKQMEGLLEREAEDGRLLGKCVEELKGKGLDFDLLKEVDALRRAKSLRIEARGGRGTAVRKWSARDFATMFFFAASCGALGLTSPSCDIQEEEKVMVPSAYCQWPDQPLVGRCRLMWLCIMCSDGSPTAYFVYQSQSSVAHRLVACPLISFS